MAGTTREGREEMSKQSQPKIDAALHEYYRGLYEKVSEENSTLREESYRQVDQIVNRNTAILILVYALTTATIKLVF
jgi:hypothetical protein